MCSPLPERHQSESVEPHRTLSMSMYNLGYTSDKSHKYAMTGEDTENSSDVFPQINKNSNTTTTNGQTNNNNSNNKNTDDPFVQKTSLLLVKQKSTGSLWSRLTGSKKRALV